MNRYLLTILASFICLWLNQSASNSDKIKVRNAVNSIFNEPNQSNYINVAAIPIAELTNNPTISGYFIVVDERQLQNLNVDLSTISNKWQTFKASMDNGAHLRVDKGATWESVLQANGMRIRQSTNGVPK